MNKPFVDLVREQQQKNHLQLLPITLQHIMMLDELPLHHRDPFDRLLIAQTRYQDFVLISHDEAFLDYDVKVLW